MVCQPVRQDRLQGPSGHILIPCLGIPYSESGLNPGRKVNVYLLSGTPIG